MTDTQNDTSGSSFFSFLWGNRSRWEKFGVIVFVLVILSTIASLIARAAFLETSRSAEFKIAVVAPMSGPDAGYGNAILKGAEQFAIANKMDAELETVIELEVFDTQGDASAAETLALEAAENDDVVAIIGGWNAQEVQAIAKVAEAHSVPMISVAPLPLGVERLSDASFSLNFSRRDEVRFLANYVRNVLGEKLVSVVVDEARFGAEADLFVETFERFGIEIRHRWSTDAAGGSADKGLQDIASEIKDTPDAGALFLALDQTDAASLTRTLRDLRAINRLVGTSELGTNAFIESLPRKESAKYAHQVLVTSPLIYDTGNEQAQSFLNSYEARHKAQPDWIAAYGFEAASIVSAALNQPEPALQTAQDGDERQVILEVLSERGVPYLGYQGVLEDLLLDESGNAEPPIKIGVYDGKTLISALTQLQPIGSGEVSNFIDAVRQGRALYVNDRFMYKTNVVYTGVQVNEVKNFDPLTNVFEMDLTIWFRYRSDFEPQDIVFANAVEPIKLESPDREEKSQDLIYRRYQLSGKFKSDFLNVPRNYGSELLGTSFRHRVLNRNNLIYVVDVVGMDLAGGSKFIDQFQGRNIVDKTLGLLVDRAWISQEITPVSGLGSPVFVGHGKPAPDYSLTNIGVIVKPGTVSLRDFIPNDLLVYAAIFAALGSFFAYLMDRKREGARLFWSAQSWMLRLICWPLLLVAAGSLVLNFAFSNLEFYYVDILVPIYETLGWIVGGALTIMAVERFIWQPLEIRAERKVPGSIRAFVMIILWLLTAFCVMAFVFGQQLTSLLATSGLAAMIIGLAIQANIANIFSGIVLNIEKPIRTGDWIRTELGQVGKVLDITWRSTKILSFENAVISLPNARLAEATIENFSQPSASYNIIKRLTFGLEVDPIWLREKLLEVLSQVEPADGRSKLGVYSVRLVEIDPIGQRFSIRFDCTDRFLQSDQSHVVLSAIREAMDALGVNFVQQRYDMDGRSIEGLA